MPSNPLDSLEGVKVTCIKTYIIDHKMAGIYGEAPSTGKIYTFERVNDKISSRRCIWVKECEYSAPITHFEFDISLLEKVIYDVG